MNLIERSNEVMSKHQTRLSLLKDLTSRGDFVLVAEKTNLTRTNAFNAFVRIGSKHHMLVVNALEEVINERLNQFQAH